jgi:hypothetical protein
VVEAAVGFFLLRLSAKWPGPTSSSFVASNVLTDQCSFVSTFSVDDTQARPTPG